jgi:RhtB (resistance to homoserine/threonine) family protein
MAYLDEFILIALAHFFAVASPGPDFAIILKQSISYGRRNALFASAGVGLGILVHVTYCLLGVALIIAQSETLFNWLKYLAAAYLAYMAFQALQAKPANGEVQKMSTHLSDEPVSRSFSKGFLTNALNPKATLFFLSLFTIVIDPNTPSLVQAGYGVYMALATWVWFSFSSLILSKTQVRAFFLKSGHWFDRGIGIVLLILAVRVVLL